LKTNEDGYTVIFVVIFIEKYCKLVNIELYVFDRKTLVFASKS